MHGRPVCFASIKQLCFVGIVREENLTVRNVLVDLVFRIGAFEILVISDEVTEAKEVRDISGRDRNCEARELSVKNVPVFCLAGLQHSLSSNINLIE